MFGYIIDRKFLKQKLRIFYRSISMNIEVNYAIQFSVIFNSCPGAKLVVFDTCKDLKSTPSCLSEFKYHTIIFYMEYDKHIPDHQFYDVFI